MGRFGKFLACSGFPECKTTKQLDENGKAEPETLDEKCPECGKPLVRRMGRFGPFIGCSGYPDCKYIKSDKSELNVKCPECGKGHIVSKRTRRGKIFYACDQYPTCEHALWDKPTGDHCPVCKKLLVQKGKKIVCEDKECSYEGTTVKEPVHKTEHEK